MIWVGILPQYYVPQRVVSQLDNSNWCIAYEQKIVSKVDMSNNVVRLVLLSKHKYNKRGTITGFNTREEALALLKEQGIKNQYKEDARNVLSIRVGVFRLCEVDAFFGIGVAHKYALI